MYFFMNKYKSRCSILTKQVYLTNVFIMIPFQQAPTLIYFLNARFYILKLRKM